MYNQNNQIKSNQLLALIEKMAYFIATDKKFPVNFMPKSDCLGHLKPAYARITYTRNLAAKFPTHDIL